MKLSVLRMGAFVFTVGTLVASQHALAQKSGQSIQIQYGVVVASSYIQEKSNAGKGALVGGAIGLYSGKGKSSGTKFRRTGRRGSTKSAPHPGRSSSFPTRPKFRWMTVSSLKIRAPVMPI